MNYTLWIVSKNTHSQCFREVAECLSSSLIDLGHECQIITNPPIPRENVIILGAHLLHPDDMLYLKTPIIWQLEQIPDSDDEARMVLPLTATYFEVLKRATVWDYSRMNIATLGKHGIEAKLLEVGYHPCLTRIENSAEPDIDVLFLGALNQRRAHILQGLTDARVKIVHAFDCYGTKRDELVSRAKVILNVHYYPAKIWEIVRCSYMMANRKCVVSETGLDDALEKPYYGAVSFTDYNGLVGECLNVLKDAPLRGEWSSAGFDRFAGNSQSEYLKAVI